MAGTLLALIETTYDMVVRKFEEIDSLQGMHKPAIVQVEVTDTLSMHDVCDIIIVIQYRLSSADGHLSYEINLGNGTGDSVRLDVERSSFFGAYV